LKSDKTLLAFLIAIYLFAITVVVIGAGLGVLDGLKTTVNPQAEARAVSWLIKDAAGFFTLWLVIVGAVQVGMFFMQLRYMRKSMRDTAQAAQAASDAATAARDQVQLAEAQIEVTKIGIFDLERAFLDVGPKSVTTSFVTDPPPPSGFFQPGVDPMEVVIKIGMHNTGRTRAAITRAYGEFSPADTLGTQPIYTPLTGTTYVTDLSMAVNGDAEFPHDFRTRHIAEQFFFGYVEYKDIFGRQHTSRFCVRVFPALENGKLGKIQLAGNDAWRACD
jgi:hypothetical protein